MSLPLFVNTSRGALAAAPEVEAELEACGVQLVTDTCTYLVPLMNPGIEVAMTDSGKWAYYAPGNLGIEVRFALRARVCRDGCQWMIVISTWTSPSPFGAVWTLPRVR